MPLKLLEHQFIDHHDPFIQILSVAVKQTADQIMITDKNATILYVNPAFIRITGFTKEEAIGNNPRIFNSGKHDRSYYQLLWKNLLLGNVFRSIMINKKKNGELYYVDQTITPIKDPSGAITHFVAVWKDITERILYEQRLKDLNVSVEFEKYKLEQILSFDERIRAITDLNELIDFVIQKSCDILESSRCSLMLVDENNGEICIKGHVGLSDEIVKQMRIKSSEGIPESVISSRQPLLVKNIESDDRISRENAPVYRSKSFMSVPILIDNKIIGVVNITEKISAPEEYQELDLKIFMAIVRAAAVSIENARMYKELKYLTITDPLTKLYNYRYFIESLDREIHRTNRFLHPLCLMLIDVDDFKVYNDKFGYGEGDFLLKEIGKLLVESLREVDVLCRYAGDEFVIILPETDIEVAKVIADRILQTIRQHSFDQKITLSLGVTQCAEKMDRRDLILKADRALFEAKRQGKNCYCYFL